MIFLHGIDVNSGKMHENVVVARENVGVANLMTYIIHNNYVEATFFIFINGRNHVYQ